MAKPLVLQFKGADLPLAMSKLDRSELYGFIETEILDEKGRNCSSGSLAPDGQTVIVSGGSALACLSPDGMWLDKSKLTPVDRDGKKLAPVPSSFSAPVELSKTATIDEYLSHCIRSVYQLDTEADTSDLMKELKKGTIFTFPYSFRGGLQPDAGFLLLGADGTLFLAIGTPTKMEFVGLSQAGEVIEETDPEGEEGGDEIDFGMM
jgi:hypothetical protein